MRAIRKIATLILTISVFVICLASCYGETETHSIMIKSTWTEQCETANEWQIGTMEKALAGIENIPCEQLSPIHISTFAITLPGQGSEMKIQASSMSYYLHHLNNFAPIERIEKIDNNHVFVVYKIFENEKEAYLRILLEKNLVNYADMDEKVERWDIDNSYFINSGKNFTRKDFAKIEIGDSALRVAEIDDTLDFDRSITETIYDDKTVFSSRKLLEDGVLVITYSAPKKQDGSAITNENYKVVDIYFNKNKNNINVLCKSPNRTPHLWDSILTWVWIAVAAVIFTITLTVILVIRRRKRATPTEAEEQT